MTSLMDKLGLPSLMPGEAVAMAELLALRKSKEAREAEAVALRKEGVKLRASLEAAKSAWNCAICFANEVNTVLSPCGHTICAPCLAALPSQTCPFDRGAITGTTRIFRA